MFESDILKGGSEGSRMAPVMARSRARNRRSQKLDLEWRCLSFREARTVREEGKEWIAVIESSGAKGAEHCCAASLRRDMVIYVPLVTGT